MKKTFLKDLPAVKNQKCLYCNKKTSKVRDADICEYLCLSCHERYFVWDDDHDLGFSCKDYWILDIGEEACNYFSHCDFTMANSNVRLNMLYGNDHWQNWKDIPLFKIDFSDKNALYNKIKLCRIYA
jgi:hypothetical protein